MLHAWDAYANEAHYKTNYLDILHWLQTVDNFTNLGCHHKEDSVTIAGWVECLYRQPKLAEFWHSNASTMCGKGTYKTGQHCKRITTIDPLVIPT